MIYLLFLLRLLLKKLLIKKQLHKLSFMILLVHIYLTKLIWKALMLIAYRVLILLLLQKLGPIQIIHTIIKINRLKFIILDLLLSIFC